MIINNEWGPAFCDNPQQGSYLIEQLTDLVEEAVLSEFDRLTDRGGVLGAMETGYQRGRIQDESLLYESRKHDGTLPIIGVNTFRAPAGRNRTSATWNSCGRPRPRRNHNSIAFIGSTQSTPRSAGRPGAPAAGRRSGENTFEALMSAVRVCSVGSRSRRPSSRSADNTGGTCEWSAAFDPIAEATPALARSRLDGRGARHGRGDLDHARPTDRAGTGRCTVEAVGVTFARYEVLML